jgi:murein DD-endopeptidase MepM/ murein hydrolase activator NlpD
MRRRLLLFLVSLIIVVVVGVTVTPPSHLLPPDVTATATETETILKPGDTLEAALISQEINRAETAQIITALRRKVNMRKVQPGERLVVTRNDAGDLLSITYWRNRVERYEIRRVEDTWQVKMLSIPVETRVVALAGTLEGSLFESVERMGEGPTLTAKFVNLFEWDFDFAADSLTGDRFRLLVEKRFANREFIGYGDILIAQYRSAGRRLLTTVGFEVKNGGLRYFDSEGRSVRKAFLRAPLDFTRITSGFSQARRHPILGGVRPHLAIDYGAPMGTPVRAVADGAVESSGWAGGSGISITLRHARGYMTMYNHLSASHVRAGQRVRQREIIGRVGSTGLSTGPHLDYRVMKNRRLVNPLSEKFIPGEPVPQARWREFREHLKLMVEHLDREASLDAGLTHSLQTRRMPGSSS